MRVESDERVECFFLSKNRDRKERRGKERKVMERREKIFRPLEPQFIRAMEHFTII